MTEEESALRRLDDEVMEDFRHRLQRQDDNIEASHKVLGEIRDTLVRHGEILKRQGDDLAKQSEVLFDQAFALKIHMAKEEEIKPALEELVALWRGSRLLIPILVALATVAGTAVMWFRDHLKFIVK